MAIKDYWIYQKRNVFNPWAIYLCKVYERYKPQTVFFDWTIYHDAIQNQTNSKSGINLHCSNVSEYVDFIAGELANYTKVTAADKTQLYDSFLDILLH